MNDGIAIEIHGHCDAAFGAVKDAFARNFAQRGEVGAGVAIYQDGEPVVDLWGGRIARDGKPDGPWQSDTLVQMMSVNKALTALCAHILVERGQLDFAKPVAAYWPEFAQAGKENITVGQLVGGMAALVYPDAVPDGAAFDWTVMATGLAAQAPNWPPGTRGAYHSSTYGNLVGEVVRRVSGRLPGVFFREEVAERFGIDYWFGLPVSEQHRLSDVLNNPESVTATAIAQGPTNPLGRAWHILPVPNLFAPLDAETITREMPSAFGRGNARAVARLYGILARGGSLDGKHLVSEETIARMRTLQWQGNCGLTGRDFRYAMGFFLNTPGLVPLGPNPNAFGQPGAGGSLGFADPERRLGFSYCTNYMCAGAGLGDRCEALIEATFANG